MAINALTTGKPPGAMFQLICDTINELLKGRSNTYISVTLTANTTTTSVADTRLKMTMSLTFTPRTANAAAALAGLYISAKNDGSFTLTHANTATTDRTFDCFIHGY